MVISWIASAALFTASKSRGADVARIQRARACTLNELFTPAPCRALVDGHVVKLTHTAVRLDLSGRQLTMPVQIVGDVSHSDGSPVVVTLWRGEPVHVEGPALIADSTGSPTSAKTNYQNAALFFLVGPPVMVGINLLVTRSRDRRPPGGYW